MCNVDCWWGGSFLAVVVVCANPKTVREILLAAEELNMVDSGEYVFFNIELFSRWVNKWHIVHSNVTLPSADLTEKTQKYHKIYWVILPIHTVHMVADAVRKVIIPGQRTGISLNVCLISDSFACIRCFIWESSRACFFCREGRCREVEMSLSSTQASMVVISNFWEWGPSEEHELLRANL